MPPWTPIPGVCELINLRDSLMQTVDARLAYLRARYVDAPVAEGATLEAQDLVRRLRAELFDSLAWDLKERTVWVFSDDHRPGI